MKILVLRGDAEGYRAPDDVGLVIEVPPREPKISDRFGQTYEVEYVDEDPADLVLVDCLDRIKRAWEESGPMSAREHSLAHAASGLWFFYWVSPDMLTMAELVRRGRMKDLRDACSDYIDAGFGRDRGPTLALAAA